MDNQSATSQSQSASPSPKKRQTLIAIISLILVLIIVYFCGLPYITGQSCVDFLSGRVPSRAEDIFLQKVFEAAVKEDYSWLRKVTADDALQDLKEVRSQLSTDFEIVWRDDLGGTYERTIQFDNGTKVYLTYWSYWSSCPDFVVTEEEVIKKMELVHIEIVSQ